MKLSSTQSHPSSFNPLFFHINISLWILLLPTTYPWHPRASLHGPKLPFQSSPLIPGTRYLGLPDHKELECFFK